MGTLRLSLAAALLGLAGTAFAQDDAPEAPAADEASAADDGSAMMGKFRQDYIVDHGIQNDPYTHTRGLTEGRMEFFRELYVDPDAFAKGLKPAGAKASKADDKPAMLESFELPEGAGDDGYFELGAKSKLDLSVIEALIRQDDHTIRETDEGGIAFTVGKKGWKGLLNVVIPDGKRIVRIVEAGKVFAEFAVADEEPGEESEEAPAETEEGAETEETAAKIERAPVKWTAPAAASKPAETGGAMAVLPVDNARSSWAEVTVNGEKVGIIGPYHTGYIHDVKAGSYDIGFTWANGFSLSKTAMTMDKPDSLPRGPGITPIGTPPPGVPAK